jgi:HSP20 family molecular chaperone IbpA
MERDRIKTEPRDGLDVDRARPEEEGFPGDGGRTQSLTRWPPIEVFERDHRVVIRAEMPGMRREDVKVRVEDDSLVIEGERKEDREARHEGRFESEWSYGRFARRVRLPAEVDPDQVTARFDNGVLEVTLNVPAASRREIPIEVRGAEGRGTEPRAEAHRGLRGAIEDRNRDLGSGPSVRP